MNHNYKQILITLSSDLRKLRYFSEKLGLISLIALLDKAIQKIEEGSFSVAVVGEFKRGKSTFINALLGQEILPSDILPTTATLNRVVYGSQPFVKILFRNGQTQKIPIEQLSTYVTKLTPESEAVAVTVEEAIIHYPVDCCQNQVEIIDTPGLCDDETMTAVTLSVLRRVELMIVVTSVLAPFAESEGIFLTEKLLSSGVGRIIFVATGIDQFDHPKKANQLIQTIQDRIETFVQQWSEEQSNNLAIECNHSLGKNRKPQVFGLSAYQALTAKQNGNTDLLIQSRFPIFEAELQRLLTQERGDIALRTAVAQSVKVATEILQEIDDQKQMLTSKTSEFDHSCEVIKAKITTLQEMKAQYFRQVNTVVECTEHHINPILGSFAHRLKQAVEGAIDSTDTSSAKELDSLNHMFADRVFQAVQLICQSTSKEIQTLVERETAKGIQYLTQLVALVIQFKSQVEQQLNQINAVPADLSNFEQRELPVEKDDFDHQALSSQLPALFPADSQLFLLQTGSKGIGTTVGVVAGALFLGPLGAAIGGTIGAGIGNQQIMKNFRSNYKSRVLEVIEQQLELANNHQKIEEYVKTALRSLQHLRVQVENKINSLISEYQVILAEIQGKRQAIVESNHKDVNMMKFETQKILENAQILFKQLTQNIEVDLNLGQNAILCRNCNHRNAFESNFCIKCGSRLV